MSTISRICNKNSADATPVPAGRCHDHELPGSVTVCVTGAGGFIASWLVKTLLLKGYNVRGTLRNPEDTKNWHLKGLEGAKERLKLYKADVLELESLHLPFEGCHGVFHIASPITNDPEKVEVAVEGTKNAVKTAAEAGVGRFVFTSSVGAMHMNPSRSPDTVLNEECWSDPDYCKQTSNWYCYGKMMAEVGAMEMAKEKGLDLVVVVPPVTVGPELQPTLSVSSHWVLNYMTGKKKTYPNAVMGFVDVRDVAEAHVLVYECPTPSGRYLCIETALHMGGLLGMISDMFPEYPITTKCSDTINPKMKHWKFSNGKLKDLGLKYTSIKRSLYETVKSMQEKGHLPPPHMLHASPKIAFSL